MVPSPAEQTAAIGLQTLSPGDVIKVAFPGAPTLEATQQIRRDGFINLAMVGEIKAADRTPAELEKELIEKYSTQLVSKEIKVTVVSTSYAVYVAGAVRNPGKVLPNRSITALEAIMEAGGYDTTKADLRQVKVIRNEGGQLRTFVLNIKDVLDGRSTEVFYLKSGDIVVVPERFVIF